MEMKLLEEERGDLVSSLGWMAIMALVLVVVKVLVDNGISDYATKIFSQLNSIFSN